jgi:hypothetical protein
LSVPVRNALLSHLLIDFLFVWSQTTVRILPIYHWDLR